MPTKDNKTLKYNYGENSVKAPFTIYADLECLLIKSNLLKTVLKSNLVKKS